jgi:SAM-dependent methyltransferase
MQVKSNQHNKELKDYFSTYTKYWKFVYNEQQKNITSFRKFEMKKRKTSVIKCLDAYARNKHLKVLDIGCGPGGFIEDIIKRGHSLVSADISTDMVTECKMLSAQLTPAGIPIFQADIEALPFSSGSFDVVLCIGVLQYLKGDYHALSEMSRIVRRGGITIITTPNILRLNNILDPYYIIWRLPKYFWFKVSKIFRKRKKRAVSSDFRKNTDFSNRRYFLKRFKLKCNQHNLFDVYTHSVGFGPITFWRKEIFTLELSVKINNFFERLESKSYFRNINSFASRWVFCLKKKR